MPPISSERTALIFLLVAAVIGVEATKPTWYENTVIYQLYIDSFQDSNGDGVGDLKGIIEGVDYLSSLGVGAVCLSPIYPTDNGNGVTDFLGIKPTYGTLQDFYALNEKLSQKGIRLLLELVPNHSSTKHPWFFKSENRNDTEMEYSDFYIWKDPKGYDEQKNPIPPNNWLSVLNTGSAWKWSEKRKQFYLHTFAENEADLNYRNPTILTKMQEVLSYWMRQGVDGFKMSSVSWLVEDKQFLDEERASVNESDPNNYWNLYHNYTMDQPEDLDVIKAFRHTVDTYTKFMNDTDDRILIVETSSSMDVAIKYYGTSIEPGANFPMNFVLVKNVNQDTGALEMERNIDNWVSSIGGLQSNWVIGNYDQHRVASRLSDEWVDVLHIVMMSLKGTAVTYYGEELGLQDSLVRPGQVSGIKDFMYFQKAPFPWNSTIFGGFSTSKQIWAPLTQNYWKVNVKSQNESTSSHLQVYRSLVELRKHPTLSEGICQFKGIQNGSVFVVIRSKQDHPTFVSAVNIGDERVTVNLMDARNSLPDHMNIIISSVNFPQFNQTEVDVKSLDLPPKSGAVLVTSF